MAKKYVQFVLDFLGIIELEDSQEIDEYGINIFNLDFVEEELKKIDKTIITKEQEEIGRDIGKCKISIKRFKDEKKQYEISLKTLTEKKAKLEAEIENIKEAQTLEELGFRDKAEAIKKLHIETKDYVVVPIPSNINKISDVFKKEKQIKVEVGDDTFYAEYIVDEADGRINNAGHLNGANSVLMIPVKSLREKDINLEKNGEISLNSSILSISGIIAFLPEERKIDFENYNIDNYSFKEDETTIDKQISDFLDYNLTDYYISEIKNHTIFRSYIPQSFENKERTSRNKAILDCLYENIKKRKINWKTTFIKIDGKSKKLSSDMEEELKKIDKSPKIDVPVILGIYSEINAFLNSEDKMNSCSIDMFYGQLLTEYMKINPKAKADYIEEEYTRVTINGRELSIKPPLPPKKDEVVKRYSRSDEDIAYKIMKLAQIVNRFSKIEDNLSKSSYELKHKLIKIVIDLSKEKERKIIVRRKFDKIKSAWAVYLEIPGYAEIGLHVLDMTNEFKELFLKNTELISLEKYDIKGFSPILSYGVNIELLKELKKLQLVDRVKCCLDMEEDTLVKLITRMGYSKFEYLNFTTEEEKKAYLEKVFSDDNIEKKLKDMQEEER